MILAAWNVNSLNVRLPRLTAWLAATKPDVACLQETKLEDHKFPVVDIAAAGYTAHFAGQKDLQRRGDPRPRRTSAATDVVDGHSGFDDEQKRVIAATIAGVRVIDIYAPNGQAGRFRQISLQARLVCARRGLCCAMNSSRHRERRRAGRLQRRPG